MKKIVIAIDGYSSGGKSTFAKALAARLGYIFIDTGAMYRAITLWAMRRNLLDNPAALIEALPGIEVDFRVDPASGRSEIFLDGERVEEQIRTIDVSNHVSTVSQLPEVRAKLVALQQQMGARKGIVMDGRDIGTVVFPDAEFKIFLTADPRVRAQRRYDELRAKGDAVSLEEIEANIRQRDRLDETRAISPLRRADDALLLDNSHMTPGQQMEWATEHLQRLGAL